MKKKRNNFKLSFDRALSGSLYKQIMFLLIVLFLVFWASFALLSLAGGDWHAYCEDMHVSKWLFPLYLLIDDNMFNGFYTSDSANAWAVIVSGITYVIGSLVFAGMLIGVIGNAIDIRVENYRKGNIHYLKSGHHVIMGYDDLVPSIIAEIFSKDSDANVLILTSIDAERVTEMLQKSVAADKLDNVIVNYGQRISKEYYKDIYLENAEDIYVVGRRSLPAHDAINIECVDSICTYLNETKAASYPRSIVCVFEDTDTYTAFKTTEIFGKVRELGIDFVPYNFYSGWAKQVFVTRSYKEKNNPDNVIVYPAVYRDGIAPNEKRHVHIVFFGATSLSMAFANEAAHMLHFPNFRHDNATRTVITFIDSEAEKEQTIFRTRNRHFFEVFDKDDSFIDVKFEFIKGDVFAETTQKLLAEWASDEHQYLTVFLVMDGQRSNFIMGMNMPDEVYDNQIPVFIRQDRADNFVTNLRRADTKDFDYSIVVDGNLKTVKRHGRYANLYPFGMNDLAYCTDETSLKRAKLINYLYNTADYDSYRFMSREDLEKIPVEKIWDDAERLWKQLAIANKWSSIYCADNIPCKLASMHAMGCDDSMGEEQMEELSVAEHNRWTVEKLLMGFRRPSKEEDKYAHAEYAKELSKNKKLFIHHDIRPYEELDLVKNLDYEIVKAIPWIVKMTK